MLQDYVIFAKGDKGLYYTDGTKMYFPMRGWEAKEGIVYKNVAIIVDKGNYAFVKGTEAELESLSFERLVERYPFEPRLTYTYIEFWGKNLISATYGNELTLFGLVDNKVVRLMFIPNFIKFSRDRISARCVDFFDQIFLRATSTLVDVSEKLVVGYQSSHGVMAEDEKTIMEACIRIYSRYATYSGLRHVSLYGNAFFCVEFENAAYNRWFTSIVFVYNGRGLTEVELPQSTIATLKKLSLNKIVSAKAIEDEITKNYILCNALSAGIVVTNVIKVFDDEITVKGFNGNLFRYEHLDSEATMLTIKESFKNLEETRKHYAKYCTKANLNELRKLSLRYVQLCK